VRGVAVAVVHNILLDVNVFRDSRGVSKEPLVAQLIIGLHYERPDWSIHLNMFYSTDMVDTNDVSSAEGNEMFGNVILEWRI